MASKETELEVNADETKYMVMCRDQDTRSNKIIQTDDNSRERIEEFMYLVTT